MEMTSKLW